MSVREALTALLSQTLEEELDCDAFLDRIAEVAEGRDLGELHPLFEHHRRICPECEDELVALKRILGAHEPGADPE